MNRTLLAPVAALLLASCAAEGDWVPSGRLDTAHLHLFTAREDAPTRRIAGLLEQGISAYRDLYGQAFGLTGEPPRLTVYLFADRGAFVRAAAREAPELDLDGVTGFYSYDSRALYVGLRRGLSEEGVAAVAVHELTHALDHQWARRVPDEGPDALPPWLLEGRADHLAYSLVPPGRIQAHALKRALAEDDLADLVGRDPKDFRRRAFVSYAMSWAFVRFLMEGDRAESFRRFLGGMPGHCGRTELEKALGPLDGLESPFRDYVKQTGLT